jgi:glycosyltransferase
MKNIYILDEYQSSAQNGIGTYLQELLKCFENHNVCLVKFNSNEKLFCIKTVSGIRVMHFPPFVKNGFLGNYKIIDKFFRLYIEDSPDNWFMLNYSPCENLLKVIKTAFPLSKLTFTIHDLGWTSSLMGNFEKLREIISDENNKKTKNKYQHIISYFREEQRMYETADNVICLCDDTYRILQDVYEVSKNKIVLIPNGLTDMYLPFSPAKKQVLKAKMRINPDEKILLVVGRTTSAKGVPHLLNAFLEVEKKYPNCRLVIIGPLYDVSMLKLSKSIAHKVSYTGLIDKKELNCWYRIADVGIIPSFSEQCSYTGIEMMMHALPIVASDGFGLCSMFKDKVNARIAKIGNRKKTKEYVANLMTAILELLFSVELCETLGKRARQTYLSCYCSEKMRAGYQKLEI